MILSDIHSNTKIYSITRYVYDTTKLSISYIAKNTKLKNKDRPISLLPKINIVRICFKNFFSVVFLLKLFICWHHGSLSSILSMPHYAYPSAFKIRCNSRELSELDNIKNMFSLLWMWNLDCFSGCKTFSYDVSTISKRFKTLNYLSIRKII